jgi:hypothetical protein
MRIHEFAVRDFVEPQGVPGGPDRYASLAPQNRPFSATASNRARFLTGANHE